MMVLTLLRIALLATASSALSTGAPFGVIGPCVLHCPGRSPSDPVFFDQVDGLLITGDSSRT